jgi:hypothetical protein
MTTNATSLGTRDLSTVAIINFSHAPEVELYRRELSRHGGVEVGTPSVEGLRDIIQQKIAIIFDQETEIQTIQTTIEFFEKFIYENPEISVRFFYLKWDEAVEDSRRFDYLNWSMKDPGIEAVLARFRIIDVTKIAPYDLPTRMNRALYKSRLPFFLRKGYDVEITHKLTKVDGENYRHITMKKHLQSELESAAEYSDKTHYVFMKEKKVQKMYRVTEEGRLEECDWDEEKTQLPHTVNIQGHHGLYSKEHNRFYRIDSAYDVSELNPQKTRPGKIDYTSIGLVIHNKELFMLDANNHKN